MLAGLFDAYERLGVADAVPLAPAVTEPMPSLGTARVRWLLRQEDGGRVYDFAAVSTLARTESGLRVVALAHEELPELPELPELRAAVGIR